MGLQNIVCLLSIFFVVASCNQDTEMEDLLPTEDRSDWLDPTDMISDYSKQLKEKKQQKKVTSYEKSEAAIESAPELELTQEIYKTTQEQCLNKKTDEKENEIYKEKLKDCEKQLQRLAAPETPFFRQFVTNLLGRMDNLVNQVEIEGELLVNVVLLLTKPSLEDMRQFSEGGAVQDAHSALVSMIQDVHETSPIPSLATASFDWVLENVNAVCIIVSTLCLVMITLSLQMQCRIRLSWGLLWKLFILIFILSIPWNWWHLYKLEAAKRYADMLQEMPPDCKPKHDQSLWEAVKASFSLDVDACTKYHQRIMTDPFWEVPPTKALAVTVTKFAVEPFEHIGTALNTFLQKTLNGLPIYLWPVALSFATLMLLLILVMSFGYRINVLHLLGIEPPQHRPALADQQHLQDENRQLTNRVKTLEQHKHILEDRLDKYRLSGPSPLPAIQPPSDGLHNMARARTAAETIGQRHGQIRGIDERDSGDVRINTGPLTVCGSYDGPPVNPIPDGAMPFTIDDSEPPDGDRQLEGATAEPVTGNTANPPTDGSGDSGRTSSETPVNAGTDDGETTLRKTMDNSNADTGTSLDSNETTPKVSPQTSVDALPAEEDAAVENDAAEGLEMIPETIQPGFDSSMQVISGDRARQNEASEPGPFLNLDSHPSLSSGPASVTTHPMVEEGGDHDPDELRPGSTSAAIRCSSQRSANTDRSMSDVDPSLDVDPVGGRLS